MSLSRLVYFSTSTLITKRNVAAELKHILTASIRNNARLGITGGLLFNRKYFVQVLEGDRTGLSDTFTRICLDPRHTDVVLVESRVVSNRIFGAWSMGFAGRTDLFEQPSGRFFADGIFDPRPMTGDQLVDFTHEMVLQESKMVSGPVSSFIEV